LAVLLANNKELNKAQKYFKHCIKLQPNSHQAHYGLGKILSESSNTHPDALKHFKIAIENDRNNYKAMCQVGIIYLQQNDFESSAEYLKMALKINPKYLTGMIAMGNLLFESENPKTACKYFR
jgi:tetratricopeptide (TPR) repeat protein